MPANSGARHAKATLSAVVVSAAILACALVAPAQAPTVAPNWNQLSPVNNPGTRFANGMAYDSAHGQAVLFGGTTSSGVGSDTWLWNGTNWTQASPAHSPTGRTAVAMAYDSAHGQVVMFGGADSSATRLNETWLWNGTDWTQANPVTAPPARNGAAMAFDSAHGQVVLFGGVSTGGTFLSDTWLWDGTNWTQANPLTVPTGRELEGMAYDAPRGEIIMFGGFDSQGVYDNQTWTWDGGNWTLQNPAQSPIGRFGAGLAYDGVLDETILFGGNSGSVYLGDTWAWNGTTWTQLNTSAPPSPRESIESMVYDSARQQIVLFGGYNSGSGFADTWEFGTPGNFGSVNVCPAGHTTPAPCSSTISLTYNFPGTVTLGTPQVVTQGVAGLDFAQANGGNCAGTIQGGSSCTLSVTFTPQLAGLRTGAVKLVDNIGNLLTTTLVYGVGQGPQIAYGPAFSGTSVLGGPALEAVIGTSPVTVNPRGMATDVSGDLFIANPSTQQLVMRAANGTVSTIGPPILSAPQSVAVDGAGDVFVADTGLRAVVEFPGGCFTAACETTVYNPSSADPKAVVVDGLGDLFIADPSQGGVVEVPAGCASSSCFVPIGSNWHSVANLALDAAGDLFVTDSSAGFLSKFPAGCTSIDCRTTPGSFIVPQGVAADAAGDVFVTDIAAAGGMGDVVELPAGCTGGSCEVILSYLTAAYDVAVDQLGQVYIGDVNHQQVLRINTSVPPSETFADTSVGSISADSPQSFTLLNVGNQTLSAVLPGFGLPGVNFVQVSGSGTPPDCLFNFSLAPGAGCNASIRFQPQQSGPLSATASATDNNLNATSVTQSFALSGNGIASGVPLTVSGQGSGTITSTPPGINCTLVAGVGSGICTANFPANSTVTLQAAPGAGYAFQAWGGVCSSSNATCSFAITGGSVETVNFVPGFSVTVTGLGTGSGTVSDNSGAIACILNNGTESGSCSASYPTGTQVPLGAIGSGNTIFAGWGGACASSGNSLSCVVTVNSALNVIATYAAPGAVQPGNLKPITAGVVYGQGGSFTSGTGNNGGVSANSLNNPTATAVDAKGNLYVADRSNSRVLFYPAGSTTATRVYGQNGSFTSNTPNNGGVTANSLGGQVFAVAVDPSGNLYIADGANNRVLYYPAGSTTATRVYGQGGSFTSNTPNNGGISANSLSGPGALLVDSGGNLYVGDTFRVLFFPAGSTTATQVYGQGGSFTTNTSNKGGVSANSLASIAGMALDSSGDLYVSDQLNARVLFYPAGSTTATRVYGQNGSFTSNTPNNGGISANSLYQPSGLAVDSGGGLYVADYLDDRILYYPFGSTTAVRVYGQGSNFNTNASNPGGVSANGLSQPLGLSLDASGNIYVADIFNNRVLEYGPFGNVNVCAAGQSTPAPCSNTYSLSYSPASTATVGSVSVFTQGTTGLDFAQANGGNCSGQILAGNSCTVNVSFTPLAPGSRAGAVQLLDGSGDVLASQPVYGVGQGPAIAMSPGTATVLPITGLSGPSGVALDAAGDVFIADYANNQIVKVAGGVQTTVPTSGLVSPRGVAVDGTGNLFISDAGNSRVVEIPAGCATSACQVTVPTTGLNSGNGGLAVDGAGDIFIADTGNARVVKITPSGVQSTVPATGLFGPFGVAVDAAGDVFIADTYATSSNSTNVVVEVTAGGIQTTLPTIGVTSPEGVWADAAGDVFIADSIPNNRIVELPAGGGAQTTVYTGAAPEGVVTDGVGNVFIADTFNSQIVEIGNSPLPLNFGAISLGASSADVPVTMQNVGNQTLTGSMGPVTGQYFFEDTGNSTCTTFSLAPGATCVESFFANSAVVGAITASAVVSDNSLNRSSTQSIPLSALSVGPTVTINATGSGAGSGFVQENPTGINCSFSAGSPSGVCSAPISTGLTISFEEVPTAGSTFTGWGGACASYGTSQFCTLFVNSAATVTASFAASTVTVPNVVALTQTDATTGITGAGLALGAVTTAFSSSVPAGSVASQNPAAGAQASPGATVDIVISEGQPPAANQLSLNNNYFVTGDYVSAGVTLRGTGGPNGLATGTITVPSNSQGTNQGVPDGADVLAAYLYWGSIENTPSPSAANGTFNGYAISGQQIGSDQPYTDGALSGTLRVYRASVNTYIPVGANGLRFASGNYTVSLPDGGGAALPLTEGASLVVIYRVLSPNFPLKSVVIYDGSAIPTATTGALSQTVEGFYDAVGGANGTGELTNLFAGSGTWNGGSTSVTLGQPDQFTETLNPGNAYAAVILSTPVNNSDNDGILDAWKAGPGGGDIHAGQAGYYDVKTQTWVALPGALHGEKDLFVQLDYMCSAFLADGVTCDFTQENLYPSPDASGHDPLAMVQQAFAADGVALHLTIGNAVPEDTCTDSPGQLCEFPNQPGVVSWDNSVQISKVWPRNFASCANGGDCTPRFQYGQKDSYHYVLFGFSLAIPAWNTRYGTLTSIQVANNVATITTADRGTGLYACPSRVTITGVLGNPNLNGVYNTTSCANSTSITLSTSNVPDWSYPNSTLPEPVIGLTPGQVSSISGYSDLGGSDSAVTLGLWETAPNQDMSKAANVIAGTLFHEIGHTLGLTHGGLYYDTPNSYIPTFEANCKPNLQSSMNYLFQLDGVGPNLAVAYSNQTLNSVTRASAGAVAQLTDLFSNPATYPTSSWYVPYIAGASTASPATLHCDGTPIGNDTPAYRVNGGIAPITPAWSNGQNITYDGQAYTTLRGYNETASMDLRQVAATAGEFADLASVLNFGSSAEPLDVAAGGSATLGSGGRVTLGSGGIVTLGSGGNVTLGSGGTITLGSGGRVILGSGGNVTLGSGGTLTPGSDGRVILGSGGDVTLSTGGATISFDSGGTITLGSGGIVTLGSGGATVNGVPEPAGPISVNAGGIIALGSGGAATLSSGGIVALGSGGIVALGSGGTVALGSGGRVTLGSGGIVALGSGGNVTLGSGGNVTLDSGGVIALGSGGTITLGSGGIVTLGSGGSVTLGGDLSSGSGGRVTLGSGGTVTLGSGGTVTLGSGGRVVLGSGGRVTLGSGGIIAMGSGGTVTLGSGGIVTLGSGGATVNGVQEPAGPINVNSGGIIALGSGGTVALGSGGDVTLSTGGTITLGSGGIVTLGSGGRVTMGSGGVVTLGSGGTIALGSGGNVALGSGGRVTLGSGGASTSELTYETANSVVRPPSAPTETPVTTGGSPSVRVDWTAPAFGVVQTYAIYRSSNGATPILIGSVSGVNGFAPATTFTDTNPDLTSQTVVYSISTVLAPVPIDPTSRQSVSVPAVLTNDQTIVLGSLPSSVSISNPTLTVTATAMSSGVPSGLQVNFTATGSPSGSCSIGNQTITGGVSSATVSLNNAGSCTITASQPGSSPSQLQTGTPPLYNAASSVSGTFTILPQGSTTQSQTIVFPTLPNAQYGNTFVLSGISASSGLPVNLSASGPCTASGGISGVGLCTITATQAGNSTYSAASESQSFTIFPAVLKVTAAPVTVVYGQAIPPLTNYAYSGFVNGDSSAVVSGAPALATTATATSNVGSYPITVSTGTLATANYSFLYVSGTLTIQQASQAITFTTPPPVSAAYNSSFTVATSGGASGNAVAFSSGGACSNSGATYTMTNSTGTCSVIANQAGNTNYSAAPTVTQTVNASGPSVTVSPSAINFGAVTLGSITTQSITVTNIGTGSVTVNQPVLSIVTGGNSNEFVAVNLCLVPLTAGKSCTITIAFVAGPFYTPQTATLNIMDNAPGSPQPVQLSATVLMPQTITFTTNPPASAAYNSSFTVAATGGASGNPVTFTSSGACSNSGPIFTMTSGTGSCSVIANQAGNSTYAAASQVTKTVTATRASQTIAFTTTPPTSAAYKSSFPVAATASSGLAVTFTSSGACSNSGATYTMTSGTGTCSVVANQAGNSNYAAAAQVTKTTAATLAAQAITFNPIPPASAAYKTTFTVVATGGGSGNAVTFTSSGSCSNSGATYTMTSGTGTCSVIANQAGTTNLYSAAPKVTQTVNATPAAQTIVFTTNPPASAAYKTTFTVAATGGASGNAVTFTSSGACSNSGATYTMTSGTGTCSVIANQAGTSNYAAATQATKTVTAAYSLASFSPTSLNFGTVTSGKSSTAQTATLTNTGTTPLIISGIAFTGTNPGNFTQTNTCPSPSSSLAAGKSCTISVTFNSTGKAVTASLTVTDNVQAGTQTVSVSGN